MRFQLRNSFIEYDDSGSGKPVVFLHGWGSSRKAWNVPAVMKQKYRVITVDLPGHGDSPFPGVLKFDDYVEAVSGLIESLRLDSPIVTGHAMGGHIAVKYCATTQKPISALVLVSGAGIKSFSTTRVAKIVLAKIGRKVAAFTPLPQKTKSRMRKWFYRKVIKADTNDDVSKNEILKETFLNLISEDMGRFYRAIKIPGYVIVTPDEGEALKRKIHNSRLIIIQNAGHFPFIDQRKRFYQELETILTAI
jgi:pimeloyl-ACP methyl ester carboxylesterase